MFMLEGKSAIVTGGASGIGEATVRRLAAAGATCIIGDITDAAELATEVGGEAHHCDVTDADAVQGLVDATVDRFGRLDIMVNNAGVLGPGRGLLADDPAAGRAALEVNLGGVLNGVRAAASVMEAGSVIVNTASMAGVVGFPGIGWYGMAKWGVVGLTKHAAVEFGPRGIRVNCVCPTGVDTPMVGAEAADHWAVRSQSMMNQHVTRLATADEVAAAIHYLVSDEASMVNGHALAVDGGLAAGPSVQFIEAALGAAIADESGIFE